MAKWRSERKAIAAEVDRVTSRNLQGLSVPQLLLARNEAKQLNARIDQHCARLRKSGIIAEGIADINDALTMTSAAVWGAALLSVPIAPFLATAAAIATPVGAAYVVGDRVRRRVRNRRLRETADWYQRMKKHFNAIDIEITKFISNPPPSSPPPLVT